MYALESVCSVDCDITNESKLIIIINTKNNSFNLTISIHNRVTEAIDVNIALM